MGPLTRLFTIGCPPPFTATMARCESCVSKVCVKASWPCRAPGMRVQRCFSMVCAKLLWFMTSSSIGAGLRMAMISQISFAFSTVSGCCSSAAGFCRTGWQRQRRHQKSHARPARLHVPDHDAVCCPAVHGVQMQHGGCSEEEPTWTSSGRHLVGQALLGQPLLLGAGLDPRLQRAQHAVHRRRAAEVPCRGGTKRGQVELREAERAVAAASDSRIPCFEAIARAP